MRTEGEIMTPRIVMHRWAMKIVQGMGRGNIYSHWRLGESATLLRKDVRRCLEASVEYGAVSQPVKDWRCS